MYLDSLEFNVCDATISLVDGYSVFKRLREGRT
jgi:hypothetical protein